ncbi:hypothetical protein CHS0354_021831 [Potamilus streckersoni]|uniref:Uncharacterized protein n=1 Tax=Potamilus streckersoni TaxID=2493646 RepID=A0AAE0VI97_9BIVA|nr:hypothetical protein CHS0354_021831 [Potamilus streckersoni]
MVLDNPIVFYTLVTVTIFVFYVCLILAGGKFLFGWTRHCKSKTRLFGKTVIITGGRTGVGKETAVDLAERGARIIITTRNCTRGEEAIKEIKNRTGNYNIECMELDLTDFDSIHRFATRIKQSEIRLDILINCAAIIDFSTTNVTKYGHDYIFATNYIGHFLLTYLLLDLLKLSVPSRIINISSLMHMLPFDLDLKTMCDNGVKYPGLSGYMVSKLAVVMHARSLSQRLTGSGVSVYAVNPGLVKTELYIPFKSKIPACFLKVLLWYLRKISLTPKAGAQCVIYAAVEESLQGSSGIYLDKSKVVDGNKLTKNEGLCQQLWDMSMEICGLQQYA